MINYGKILMSGRSTLHYQMQIGAFFLPLSILPSFPPLFLSLLPTRDQLAYARLSIREALQHGGIGWLDYDRAFHQQAAADPGGTFCFQGYRCLPYWAVAALSSERFVERWIIHDHNARCSA